MKKAESRQLGGSVDEGEKKGKWECCPQLSEIFEKTWEISQKTSEFFQKTWEILGG